MTGTVQGSIRRIKVCANGSRDEHPGVPVTRPSWLNSAAGAVAARAVAGQGGNGLSDLGRLGQRSDPDGGTDQPQVVTPAEPGHVVGDLLTAELAASV